MKKVKKCRSGMRDDGKAIQDDSSKKGQEGIVGNRTEEGINE